MRRALEDSLVEAIETAFGVRRDDAPVPGDFLVEVHRFVSYREIDKHMARLLISAAQILGRPDAPSNLELLYEHLILAKRYAEAPRQFSGIEKVLGREVLATLKALTDAQKAVLFRFGEAAHASLGEVEPAETIVEFQDWLRKRPS